MMRATFDMPGTKIVVPPTEATMRFVLLREPVWPLYALAGMQAINTILLIVLLWKGH